MPRTLRRPLPWILLGGLILVAGIGFALSRGLVNLTAVASPSTIGSASNGTPSSSGSAGASGGSGSATPGAGSPSVTVGTTASPTVSTSPTSTPRTTPAATAVPATPAVTAQPTPIPPPPGGGGTAVLVGAGDISTGGPAEKATAALLAKIPGTVFTAGDNAYNDGSKTDYVHFNASWGAFKSRMRPAPGNHDYHLSPQYYYTYFGAAAGPPGLGYYVYTLGAWRIYSLNGENVSAGQVAWLKNDLAGHPSACVLAYWHEPRFSSGQHGSDASYAPFWDALYAAKAEIIINGHDHDYERFAPQNPAGQASATGIREFVVGTGGAGLRGFTHAIANSEVRNGVTNGVLKLTLSPGHYGWQFIPVAGQSFTDSGQGSCH